ncbi:retrovirus-related pol polyprotein from transposon TNT 1-94 [Tanacetum coccineum]
MSNQQDINSIRAQRPTNTHDPLALMENTQTPFHPDQSSHITYIQHPQSNNKFVLQPSFNTNYMQQPMQNPKDISDPTTALDMALELMSKAFQLNNTTTTNNNQRSSSNPCYSQIAQSGMNIDQDRQMLMVDDNVGNQFRENAVQNVGHLVGQNAVQNQGTQNVGNQNGLSVVPGIANQHGNGNVVAARAEGNSNEINGNQIRCYNCRGEGHYASNCTVKPRKRDAAYLQTQLQIAQKDEAGIQLNSEEFDFMAAAGAYDEIEKVTANYNLQDNLQQASTSGTQSDKAPVYDSDGSAENDSNVISAVSSVEQSGGTVEQHPANVEETRVLYDSLYNNLAIEVEKKALELEIERLLREVVSQDIMSIVQNNSVVDASNLQTELDPQLFDKVSEQKDTTRGTSANTKFAKQSILGKPPSSSRPKLYVVTPLPKSTAIPKVGKTNVLSNKVTSNSVSSSRESKVMKNDNMIALGMFSIDPRTTSRKDNFVPNKHLKVSVRTKPITVLQPHVTTKNDENSKTNGFSPKDIKSTTRTRRPQPRNNPKNDKLAIPNAKSEVVCAMCKQCLITVNHDVCMLNYVNDMNSRALNKNENVENVENQKKHKPKVRKAKKVGSKERLASPKPSTPRSCFRWSPTGRMFDLKGKIIATSEYVCQSDCSKGDNAYTSNPQEPFSKRFPNSTFSITGCQNWLDTLLILLLSEYKPKDKENHGDNECDN